MARWLELRKPKVEYLTWLNWESLVRVHIVPAIGDIRLQRLTALRLEEFFNEKGKTRSPGTVKAIRNLLRSALRKACGKWARLASNVADLTDAPKSDDSPVLTLDED